MPKGMQWKPEAIEAVAWASTRRAMAELAEGVLTDAKDRTPHETGTLRRSGTVTYGELPDMDAVFALAESGQDSPLNGEELGKSLNVFVSFNTPYARRQHEELEWVHTDGEAKYLENAFNEVQPKVAKFIELRVRRDLRRGGVD